MEADLDDAEIQANTWFHEVNAGELLGTPMAMATIERGFPMVVKATSFGLNLRLYYLEPDTNAGYAQLKAVCELQPKQNLENDSTVQYWKHLLANIK